MTDNTSSRSILWMWFAWVLLLFGFQEAVTSRIHLVRPDYVLPWTASLTGSQNSLPYLDEPFLNTHIAWDSAYYLSIALGGYEDPQMPMINPQEGRSLSLNLAFFPFYPCLIRTLEAPIHSLGFNPVAACALAGILISLLGTLAALFGLFTLARDELGENGGLRAVFYLLIFPTNFFIAQVYSEGLFLGLAFSVFALLKQGRWRFATALAILAVLTRPVGVALVIPLVLNRRVFFREKMSAGENVSWRPILQQSFVLLPLVFFVCWMASPWGESFRTVEAEFFKLKLFHFQPFLEYWGAFLWHPLENNPQTIFQNAVELFILALSFLSCFLTLRRDPGLSLFGLAALLLPIFSGTTISLSRYALVVPSLYLMLARFGNNQTFDRIWTLFSILLMGFLALLFSFDFWVA